MEIQCVASIPLEQDEPLAAIRQFLYLLRNCADRTERGEVNLQLVGSSARAHKVMQEFRPERVNAAPFPEALDICAQLAELGTAQIKSLHFFLTAKGFAWKGGGESTSAKLALLDGKSLQRKQRFSFLATLLLEAGDPADKHVSETIARVNAATRLNFSLGASLMHILPNEPGRATQEELFVTALSWMEATAAIGKRVREEVSIEGLPRLMTTSESMKFRFDPARSGKSPKVDFRRGARRWLASDFPEYELLPDAVDGEVVKKEIAPGLLALLTIDKKPKAFSKEFSVHLGIGLTSPRFAPAADQPYRMTVGLFELFGIAPLPLKWTYDTQMDLAEAFGSAGALLRQVLPIFEAGVRGMVGAHKRRLDEFAGPREISAREAYENALPMAKSWAADATLIRLNAGSVAMRYLGLGAKPLRSITAAGRLASAGTWHLRFYSPTRQEWWNVRIPCRGDIAISTQEAPHGRSWPSDVDRMIRDGWIDSIEAVAKATSATGLKYDGESSVEIQGFELTSESTLSDLAGMLPKDKSAIRLGGPQFTMKDGMLPMQTAWRVNYSMSDENGRTITQVTVAAYGEAGPTVKVHAYNKHGIPIRV